MAASIPEAGAGPARRYLSLRWQTFIALALSLALTQAIVGTFAHRQSTSYFTQEHTAHQLRQAQELQQLLIHNDHELAGFKNLLPALGGRAIGENSYAELLQQSLENEGSTLALEWDISNVYLTSCDERPIIAWPREEALPEALQQRICASNQLQDRQFQTLACHSGCLQYIATPVLWQGDDSQTLVLARSVADALLTFQDISESDVALVTENGLQGTDLQFSAITQRLLKASALQKIAAPLFAQQRIVPAKHLSISAPVEAEVDERLIHVFRVDGMAPGVSALIIDDATSIRDAIRRITIVSLVAGLVGFILAGLLLGWLLHYPLNRLTRVATALPLLADGDYDALRKELPADNGGNVVEDELDYLTSMASLLADRMESVERNRHEAMIRVAWLANHDPLTHTRNRTRLMEELATTLAHAQRYERAGALLFLDLDRFKEVNDLSSHQVGDRLLVAIANRLEKVLRPSDVLARVGGDEFVLLLPEASQEEAECCASRVHEAVVSEHIVNGSITHRCTASIGIVLFPDGDIGPDELMMRADLAMYQAKQTGPGCHHVFGPGDLGDGGLSERAIWRKRIEHALEHDELVFHYQPVVNIRTGELSHYEALLRMQDDNELYYPDRFIPIAEQTGQIRDIDTWVVQQAIRLLADNTVSRLAVNLSSSALRPSSVLNTLPDLLRQHELAEGRLILELTETTAMLSLSDASTAMSVLQSHGVEIALDDFGSGYASYAYLRELPVSHVKIDGAFVRNLPGNNDDRLFVKSITDMAHTLGKQVVAEFVENDAVYRMLAELGVDYAQGYHLGRPDASPNPGPWQPALLAKTGS